MAALTIEELNTLTSAASGGTWTSYESFVEFVSTYRSVIMTLSGIIDKVVVRENEYLETNIDEVIQDNSDFDTLDDYIAGSIGLDRDQLRNVFAASIREQTNDLLNQNTLSSIMVREIFLDIIRNKSGDVLTFDTVPLDDPDEDDRGKYFVEND